ncbi:MAG: hypothetical protein CMM59_12860 [Rhodospirillaceae bacterium]|nr:hypothetical protein [Rhodospirillaceae bacterium]|tara:strand:+ start:1112 stop:1756 length:645 start_codon:yes stop_codon:yes gene_type:complete
MHISAAELETTVMKAAIGAGVASGIAIEIGKAAVALSDHGIDASTVIAIALKNLDRKDANGFAIDDARNGIFLPKAGYLSAILAGPSICDLLASGQNKIIARDLDVPILAVSLLAARRLGVNARHSAEDLPTATCANGRFTIAENQVSAWRHPGDIEFSLESPEGSIDQVRTARANEVDGENWLQITMFADRCLVSGSEESRLQDAGAGLIDED